MLRLTGAGRSRGAREALTSQWAAYLPKSLRYATSRWHQWARAHALVCFFGEMRSFAKVGTKSAKNNVFILFILCLLVVLQAPLCSDNHSHIHKTQTQCGRICSVCLCASCTFVRVYVCYGGTRCGLALPCKCYGFLCFGQSFCASFTFIFD